MLVLGMRQVTVNTVRTYLLLELPGWNSGQQTVCRTWSVKRTGGLAGCGRYRKQTCQSDHQPVCMRKKHLQLLSCFGLSVQTSCCSHAGLRYCGHVMASAYKHVDPQQV